jgi:phage gp29-like protein
MVRDATVVLPYGSQLELVSPSGATGDYHEKYLQRMDAAISKVLMGNTLTAEIGDTGSYAAAETHKEVADDFADSDIDLVIQAMNDLAWYYARFNAGPDVLAPVFEYEEPEDLEKAAELDAKLYGLGVRFNQKHFVNKFSLAEDEFSVSEERPAGGFGEFADGKGEEKMDSGLSRNDGEETDAPWEAIEGAVRRYAPEAAAAGEQIFSQVWKIVDEAESFEELERGLAGLMGATTGPDALEDLLADLMVNANLMGRVSQARERRND